MRINWICSDLATYFEAAETAGDATYAVFLDVCCAYDSLAHNTTPNQVQALGVSGRILNFIEDFPRDRSFVVDTCGITGTSRKITQGVPQGSVLSPLLFNIAMAAVPSAVSTSTCLSVRMTIYAGDVAMLCIGRSTQAQGIRASLQESLNSVSRRLTERRLSLLE